MSQREVWQRASLIVAEFGDDDTADFVARFTDILKDTANPDDWRRIAAAVDVIAAASKQ